MKWKELIISTTNEALDAINNILMESGSLGVQIRQLNNNKANSIAYFSNKRLFKDILPVIQKNLENMNKSNLNVGSLSIKTSIVDDKNWIHKWENYYHVTKISHFITIVPSWKKYRGKSYENVIYLNPGQAFGTGVHPTTQLSLQAMETMVQNQRNMIDVGTGSGVLSIAGYKLGIPHINAFDISDHSIESARRNIKLNRINNENIIIKKNSLLDNINTKTDIIVANMLPDLLIKVIPQTVRCLNKNGILILAGIIKEKLSLIKKTLLQNNFKIYEVLAMDDWRSIIAIKS